MNLVQHVCTETQGLESLFLISKSNCAFANFSDEERCVAAQQKLHDSKFQSVRLVSRLRKSTVEGSAGQTAPTGPASTSPVVQSPIIGRKHDTGRSSMIQSQDAEDGQRNDVRQGADPDQPRTAPSSAPQIDRFFVLKSLTVEDLELSVQNGVWATQSHNEEALNTAFEVSFAVLHCPKAAWRIEYSLMGRLGSFLMAYSPLPTSIWCSPQTNLENTLDTLV